MPAYYNEHDAFAAAWLRELIREGLIADGEVDERDIRDVRADDMRGFTQCHFFAGIGGWSYALRLAGWDDARPVWTGSCPCQPFSSAGTREGGRDDRHLWPYWARLIGECRPVAVFGEQVESAIAHGWLDAVFDDLEREGYACGAACVPAASVGAPHIRQRVWFVADAEGSDGRLSIQRRRPLQAGVEPLGRGEAGDMGNSDDARPQGRQRSVVRERAGERSAWSASDLVNCRDGKARPVEPGTFPLAHGVSARVGRLRGYGNAIVPQVAAEVIAAYMEVA